MKKYILIVGMFVCLVSCEDKLEITPDSRFTTASFFKNEADIEQTVTSAYAFLQAQGQYGENFHFLMEVPSDNSKEVSLTIRGGGFSEFEVFQVATTNEVLTETWSDCYKAIQSCNIVLNRIDDIPDMTDGIKSIRKGEMQFLRGLNYFNIVRIWGDAPLVTTETVDPFDFFDVGRNTTSEIYAQIIEDLTNAISNLPVTPSQQGRAAQGAAYALLGKVHLTLKNYKEAELALREVKGYALEPTFGTVFGTNFEFNGESIFEVSFIAGLESEGSKLTNLFAPTGESEVIGGVGTAINHNAPTMELYNLYEAGDQRRDLTVGLVNGKTFPQKYMATPLAPDDSDINVIVLRYADVILMLAEALNEQQYVADGEAFNLLNQIRNRAGLTSLNAVDLPDQESFRNAVALERRLELAFENHRWFDLIRTGKAVETMNNSSQETTSFLVENYHTLFPIPQSQVDTNPDDILQNTGY